MQRKQHGITLLGVIFVLVVFGFLLLMLFRLAPVYIESFSVSSSLESLQEDMAVSPLSTDQIRQVLQRRFQINDVSHVAPDDIQIRKTRAGIMISVSYEARVPLVGNLDAVASFSKTVEVAR